MFLDVVIDDNLSLASQEMDSNWVSLTSSHIAIVVNPDYVYRNKNKAERWANVIIDYFAVFLSILQTKKFFTVKSRK